MKKVFILVSAVLVLAVAWVVRAEAPPGNLLLMNDKTDKEDAAAPVQKRFRVELKNGGSIETDNYTIEGGKVKLNLPAGAISFDRDMVKSIHQVRGEEGGTVQRSLAPAPPPREQKPGQEAPAQKETAAPPAYTPPAVETDDNGHSEEWWKDRIDQWKKKLKDAEIEYAKAKADWDKYNAAAGNAATTVPAPLTDAQKKVLTDQGFTDASGQPVIPTQKQLEDASGEQLLQLQQAGVASQPTTTIGSQYDVTRYEDLRGAARVRMDQAQAAIDEARTMLNETLPDEARRAGAPPGWAR